MNKAKKSLLFSLLSLVFALAITATSTYAWFVVNRTVTATNMQVTVKSDTTWLVIGANATRPATVAAIGTDGTQTSAAATASDAEVLPVMYDENESVNFKWKTNVGTAYDDGTAKNATYTSIDSNDLAQYCIKYTFYVGLTATTAENQANLRVNSMTVTANGAGDAATFLPAVSAMVDCNETGGAKIDYPDINGMGSADYTAKSALLATVTKNTVYQIDVYVYINGDNGVVKSSNAAKLGGFTLSIEFGVSAPAAVNP